MYFSLFSFLHRVSTLIHTGNVEAKITAIVCSTSPEDRTKCTVHLIADRAIELKILDTVSPMSVLRTLKNGFHPHPKNCWCIPKGQDSAFVTNREGVLAVYARPHDPEHPVAGMNEKAIVT